MAAFDALHSAMDVLDSDQVKEYSVKKVCSQLLGTFPLFMFSVKGLIDSALDVPGLFARDLRKLGIFAKAWYGDSKLDVPNEVSNLKTKH